MCNGILNCDDDESRELCDSITCAEDKAKCGYGACIPKTAVCNGEVDCADGSDENNCVSTAAISTNTRVDQEQYRQLVYNMQIQLLENQLAILKLFQGTGLRLRLPSPTSTTTSTALNSSASFGDLSTFKMETLNLKSKRKDLVLAAVPSTATSNGATTLAFNDKSSSRSQIVEKEGK